MVDRFRIALVGAGMISRQSHLPAALASDRVQLVAIVDPVVARAKSLASDYGINPILTQDVRSVLDKIDGALIATPNDSHKDLALTCLESGVSVLIEKPLALSSSEGSAIAETARRSGRVAAVGYVTRFRESTVLLKRLLDQGYFGAVKRYVHQFGTVGGWAPLSAYNLSRRASGGGVLVVTGTHFLDRMLYFWGYPDNVALEDDSAGGLEANCVAVFRYDRQPGPIEGCAIYSKTTALPGGMVIETVQGAVMLADTESADIRFLPHGSAGVEHVIRPSELRRFPTGVSPWLLQIEDFVDSCRNGTKPMVDAEEGNQSLRLIEALYAHRRSQPSDWYPALGQRKRAKR